MGIQIANVWHFDRRLYPIRPIRGSPNTAFKPSLGELYKKHSVLHQNWPILDPKSKNSPLPTPYPLGALILVPAL